MSGSSQTSDLPPDLSRGKFTFMWAPEELDDREERVVFLTGLPTFRGVIVPDFLTLKIETV